jgi:hypothetical protein
VAGALKDGCEVVIVEALSLEVIQWRTRTLKSTGKGVRIGD